MSTSAMSITGLDEFNAKVDAFPSKFDQAAEAVALATGRRVETRAQAILKSKVRGNPITITVRADRANRQVLVEADAAAGKHTEIHLMFEYGTAERQQKAGRRTGAITAVRYMRDSVASEHSAFPKAIDAALQGVLGDLFKG